MADQILTIQLDQADAVSLRLNQIVASLERPQPLMNRIGARLEAAINQRFVTKTDPNGQAWAPISALTPQFYALFGHGKAGAPKPGKERWAAFREGQLSATMPGTLLERTRLMLQSLTHNSGADYTEVGFNRATDGGTYQVAMLHEFGTKTMMRRGLLTADPNTGTLGAGDQADILAEMSNFLAGL